MAQKSSQNLISELVTISLNFTQTADTLLHSPHLGLRRYKLLNFDISSAAEVFQNAIAQTLQGIKGVKNLSDDIIVYGVSQRAHDEALRAVFQRLKDSGLTLNHEKCEFN